MKKIEDHRDLNKKIVLLRVDLNVPIEGNKIKDPTRIIKVIPAIKYLLSQSAKIAIISHIGRPKGKINKDLSLSPVCEYLVNALKTKIKLISENLNKLTKNDILNNFSEKILILENIRFYPEEEKNDLDFAKKLASLGDVYVNEAFSCSHRAHSSISSITSFISSYAGPHLAKEIAALNQITESIQKPISCIIGGSKISTKINVIKNLVTKYDNIIIVGAMANNFIKYDGKNIGKSFFEKNSDKIVESIYSTAQKFKCKITFPSDVSVGKNIEDNSNIKDINKIENDDLILDIGSKTINFIKEIINNSKTILWNGPAGYFENENFALGSYEIAREISNGSKKNKLFSVVGGGDTVSVINKLNLMQDFNFVSTAGGAFLEYLEGKKLPGIKSLN